ncbi:MAG: translation initiation factor IF-2 [Chlorobi bacterium]|nr:translation initiation factor IF-2 [Chlorobiota bacterium]
MTINKKAKRLSKLAREFNVGILTIVEFLKGSGIDIDTNPNTKVSAECYELLVSEYDPDRKTREESEKLELGINRAKNEIIDVEEKEKEEEKAEEEESTFIEPEVDEKVNIKVVGKIDLEPPVKESVEIVEEEPEQITEEETIDTPTAIEDKEQQEIEVEEQPTAVEAEVEEKPKKADKDSIKVVGKIDLSSINQKTRPPKKTKQEKEEERKLKHKPKKVVKRGKEPEQKEKQTQIASQENTTKEDNFLKTKVENLSGPTIVGKIEIKKTAPKAPGNADSSDRKKKRKRIKKDKVEVSGKKPDATQDRTHKKKKNHKEHAGKPWHQKAEVSEEEVQKQIKDTLARLTSKGKSKSSKYRRSKRDAISQRHTEEAEKQEQEKNILKVTEFVTANELATMMNVSVTEVISAFMSLGMVVSINQRLDAETMVLVAEEFNHKVEFVDAEVLDSIEVEEDDEKSLIARPPIVTVMGHVDHGKTSLLDFIRKTNVIAGEAGGITQHIGAYNVTLKNKKKITFLDTPGHEAFTAMRARGAQVTDVAIIVVAADDNVMPQTVEAINHAQAANVPIVFAINKIDKPGANPEKIKEELANMNLLVEEWGGKHQSQDISAKKGENIEELLEKVLLEAEMLELKANPNKNAVGVVLESSLDKGRGYITTVLVEGGTLKLGDIVLAGSYTGKVKALYNERDKHIENAGPATPALILGLNGAPQAGDKFTVMENEREAKAIANKRKQLHREQGLRTQKHITLDEIGRRIAIGNFQNLDIVIKGDVDGSIEALSDSLIKLSTNEIQVNVIHKGVGAISESDVLLAVASNAIIIGFQVRPTLGARKLAEREEIDIRLYSIIYDAINELKDAMEGMLSPEIKEEIVSTLEIRETFKITKVGTIAGCMVKEGKINRNTKVRIIRDGIVIYTGELGSLKRFKDDVKEVSSGYECGLNIMNFNDIKVGDIIEGYKEVEIKRKL